MHLCKTALCDVGSHTRTQLFLFLFQRNRSSSLAEACPTTPPRDFTLLQKTQTTFTKTTSQVLLTTGAIVKNVNVPRGRQTCWHATHHSEDRHSSGPVVGEEVDGEGGGTESHIQRKAEDQMILYTLL